MSTLRDIKWPKRLSNEEQLELIRKWQQNGDIAARNKLVVHSAQLILHFVRQRARVTNWDLEDAFGHGVIGFVKCLNNYDPALGALSTHAKNWINAEITIYKESNLNHALK